MRCTRAVIYEKNLENNINEIKKNLLPNVKLCCAVKANGYGNDAVFAAKTFVKNGAEYLAIATVDEGIELRQNSIDSKLILLSLCVKEEFSNVIKAKITPTLFDKEMILRFNEECKAQNTKSGVFLALDTGMGRIGCFSNEAPALAKLISSSSNLFLEGMITHFSVSDSVSKKNIEYTKKQYEDFKNAIENVKKLGINPGICTCSSSAGGMTNSEYQMDMVRPGIILYGYYPDEITKSYLEKKGIYLNLKPAMQLETQIVAIRRFSKGMSVSYGRTWKARSDTDIAVLPIGYADGLLRRNSPSMKVTINGKLYPIVGRICMDQCMVDIGLNNKDVKRFDKAIIFGPRESGALKTADDVAKETNTISYEIMTSVSKRVERTFVEFCQ